MAGACRVEAQASMASTQIVRQQRPWPAVRGPRPRRRITASRRPAGPTRRWLSGGRTARRPPGPDRQSRRRPGRDVHRHGARGPLRQALAGARLAPAETIRGGYWTRWRRSAAGFARVTPPELDLVGSDPLGSPGGFETEGQVARGGISCSTITAAARYLQTGRAVVRGRLSAGRPWTHAGR